MNFSKTKTTTPEDLVCLSHLRWGFVYQRPQHLLSRFAKHQRVFFVEEPVPTSGVPRIEIQQCPETWRQHLRSADPRRPEPRVAGHDHEAAAQQSDAGAAHLRLPAVVLHADGALVLDASAAPSYGVRLHGRTVGFQRCAPGDEGPRSGTASAGPISSSRAVKACTKQNLDATTICMSFRAASNSRTSRRPVLTRQNRPIRPGSLIRALDFAVLSTNAWISSFSAQLRNSVLTSSSS